MQIFTLFFIVSICGVLLTLAEEMDGSANDELVKPANCKVWHSMEELLSQLKSGDIITIQKLAQAKQNVTTTRSVIYVGEHKVVYQASNNNAKQILLLGTFNKVMGSKDRACVNANDCWLPPDPNANAISRRALSQLANAARYGHNKTWIEQIIGQSSLALQQKISGSGFKLRKQLSELFGKFTEILVDNALKSSSASLLGEGAKSSAGMVGSSLGAGIGTLFG
uniref:LRAT domain-containing protein n=1 Tax=Globodera pallida TaxID=36090 RepID=A0A183C9S6_GLOPA